MALPLFAERHRALEAKAVSPSREENQRFRCAGYERAQHARKEPIWVMMGLGVSEVRVLLNENIVDELSEGWISLVEECSLFY